MKKSIFIFAFLAFLFITPPVSAQVVINEMVTFNASGDWIELYSNVETDISSWKFQDTTSTFSEIPLNTVIGPSSDKYYIVEVGNRLNKDGDIIKLLSKDGSTVVDQISYGDKGGVCAPTDSSQSAGRDTDGSDLWVRFQTSTKRATNNDAPKDPCPGPSPSPTTSPSNTPSPTKTPTPTKIPTPIKSGPTPYSSPTPTVKPTTAPTLIALNPNTKQESTGTVLGIEELPSPTVIVKESSSSFKSGAKVALILGMLFCGVAIMVFTQRIQKLQNEKN